MRLTNTRHFQSNCSSTIGTDDKNTWKSSYQAFADGTDDIGKVRKLSRKKSHPNNNMHGNTRSDLNLFSNTRRHFMTGMDNLENQRKNANQIPGYTGFVPKTNPRNLQLQHQQQGATGRSNPADKSLLAENYRHNVVGYTGHVK